MNAVKNENTISSKKLMSYLGFTVIFITFSILTLWYLFKQFKGQLNFNPVHLFSLSVIIQLMFLLIVYFLFDTLRFYFILRTLKIRINFFYMFKLTFINIFVSNVTPFATGGGFAQIFFLSKKGVSVGDSTAAASIRTLLPILFFFIVSPFILLYNKELRHISSNNITISILLIISFLIFIFLCFKVIIETKIIKKYIYTILSFLEHKKIISSHRKKKILKSLFIEIDRFAYSVKLFFTGNLSFIVLSIMNTIIFLFILFLFPVILIKGLNYDLSIGTIISVQILVTFLTYFAPTPGATGIAEGGFASIFQNFVASKHIPDLTYSWRFFTIYVGLILGLVLFYLEIFKKRK